jgi:hypothetical protein
VEAPKSMRSSVAISTHMVCGNFDKENIWTLWGKMINPWDYAIVVPSLQQLGLSGILQLELSVFLDWRSVNRTGPGGLLCCVISLMILRFSAQALDTSRWGAMKRVPCWRLEKRHSGQPCIVRHHHFNFLGLTRVQVTFWTIVYNNII